jgi:SAM-dependent methyltransferase
MTMNDNMNNYYSTTWFELFLDTIEPEQTEREAAFVARWLPQPAYTTVLDICCGLGRHARALAQRGYRVTGVDLSAAALAAAHRESGAQVIYLQRDMRNLDGLPGSFDAAVCLWQSFGAFDAATNADVLGQISRKFKPNGRLILDIYHREFFERNQGTRGFERGGSAVTETKLMDGDRLMVRLDYEGRGEADEFEWQLFTPDEICELAEQSGFRMLTICTGFDESQAVSAELPRMQLVFEKRSISG